MTIHHRKLPEKLSQHWALICGRAPPDDFGFKSDRLQIFYNSTDVPWVDAASHAHTDSDEVYIVLEGVMSVRVEGTLVHVAAGELLCVPAGSYHQLESVATPMRSFVIRSPSVDDKVVRDDNAT